MSQMTNINISDYFYELHDKKKQLARNQVDPEFRESIKAEIKDHRTRFSI